MARAQTRRITERMSFLRRLREHVSAARAARALHHIRATKAKQDLLDVIGRQLFHRCDLPASDRTLGSTLREMKRADHAILGPRRYSHALKIVEYRISVYRRGKTGLRREPRSRRRAGRSATSSSGAVSS